MHDGLMMLLFVCNTVIHLLPKAFIQREYNLAYLLLKPIFWHFVLLHNVLHESFVLVFKAHD